MDFHTICIYCYHSQTVFIKNRTLDATAGAKDGWNVKNVTCALCGNNYRMPFCSWIPKPAGRPGI